MGIIFDNTGSSNNVLIPTRWSLVTNPNTIWSVYMAKVRILFGFEGNVTLVPVKSVTEYDPVAFISCLLCAAFVLLLFCDCVEELQPESNADIRKNEKRNRVRIFLKRIVLSFKNTMNYC